MSIDSQAPRGAAIEASHEGLAVWFETLRRARGDERPVFAIEHGLEASALADLTRAVSRRLEAAPDLDAPPWRSAFLPLLVVATEAAYRYRGNGTEFWPILAQDLGLDLARSRSDLSRLFRRAHERFGLARPGHTPWERCFAHIAWPIANAVAPLEIQAPLAEALRRTIRVGGSSGEAELLEQIRILAAGRQSRRFENWLHGTELALETMRRLLDLDAPGWLSEAFLRRVDEDLRRDPQSRRAIGEARRISARRPARGAEIAPARFVLRLKDGEPQELSARGPLLSAEAREEAAAVLRLRGGLIHAAGSEERAPLRLFLAGGEISLGAPQGWPEAPLRRGDDLHEPSAAARALLEALQPRVPQLLQLAPDGASATALLPEEPIERSGKLLQNFGADEEGGFLLRRLDMEQEEHLEIVRRLGRIIRDDRAAPEILGLPASASPSAFIAGFPLFVALGPGGETPVLDDAKPPFGVVRLGGRDLAFFRPGVGAHVVGPPGAEDARKAVLLITEPPDVDPAEISVNPPEPDLADLFDETLEIRLRAPLPLEDLSIRLRLAFPGAEARAEESAEDLIVEGVVKRLPADLAGRAPLLQALREKLAQNLAKRKTPLHGALRLFVEAQGFAPLRLILRPARRPFRFDRERAVWSGEEGGDLVGSRRANGAAPIPSAAAPPSPEETTLILPDSGAPGALGSGLAEGGPKAKIGEDVEARAPWPRALRERRSRDGRWGFDDLARALLGWRLAEAADPLADWRRRETVRRLESVAVGLLCGEAWRKAEAGLDLSLLSPHGALVQSAQEFALSAGEDLPRLEDPQDRAFLRRRLQARFAEAAPDLSAAVELWSEDLAGDLDMAVIDAYEDLRRDLEESGRTAFAEVDMSRPSKLWERALRRAEEAPSLPMFRRLVLPEARWSALQTPRYELAAEDDLVDLLDARHLDAYRRPGLRWIGRTELRVMLQFWLSPRALTETEDWPELLAKGLSDAQTARAVRYVALRRKTARFDLPAEFSADASAESDR